MKLDLQAALRHPLAPRRLRSLWWGIAAFAAIVPSVAAAPQDAFAHWETPPVSALALDADGETLLVAHTADARLLVLDVRGARPVLDAEIQVGLDPVSVRWFDDRRAWVVNHMSDSISVVDVPSAQVLQTVLTADEPCDVVFAGNPVRAFVSCSQANRVQVFDVDPLTGRASGAPIDVPIEAEDPRALAVSADGQRVHVAIFESGNATTILGGGLFLGAGSYPPNAVSDPDGPHGGANPPPHSSAGFEPPLSTGLATAPEVGLVVRRDAQGVWRDDTGADWTRYVTGDRADRSGRRTGWTLLDRDLATIDATTLAVDYAGGALNVAMAVAVRPGDGRVTLVGTDAANERRFEPNLNGRFLTVALALASPGGLTAVDLNPHLPPGVPRVDPALRARSLADPRALTWDDTGTRGWVAGLGSNNVVEVDPAGNRSGPPIEVGAGPSALAHDGARGRLYVLERFDSAVAVVDTTTRTVIERTPLIDPTPAAIRDGRPLLYDAHATSGTGHVSCASCHVDARTDGLAWDLGDPSGSVVPFVGNCRDGQCEDWHPMKGPMLTQTLQDIVGHEPHHWRGDRAGLEAFDHAFETILGADHPPSAADMQRFEAFLSTVRFPPNPFRRLDNSLATDLPLEGHFATGRFGPAGTPLPTGDAVRGLALYRPPNFLDGVACVNCHTLPTGSGSDTRLMNGVFVPIPEGPLGEHHHPITSGDGSSQRNFKIPQLRNLHERVGFEATQLASTSGYGFLHDGSVDSLARFVSQPAFGVQSDQDVADLVAFLLSFSGSDLPLGSATDPNEPPGTPSFDTHAAVGQQVTLEALGGAPEARLDALEAIALTGRVELIAKGTVAGEARGFLFDGGTYRSDRAADSLTGAALRALAAASSPITWTVVVTGTGERLGVDRDLDGALDRDELDAGSDPADPLERPIGTRLCAPAVPNSTGRSGRIDALGSDVVLDGRLVLRASSLPAHAFGYFLNARMGGTVFNAGGSQGTLCLGGHVGRFDAQVRSSGAAGVFAIVVDVAALPRPTGAVAILPGDSWVFQAWHRDVGGVSNLTDAVETVWQ